MAIRGLLWPLRATDAGDFEVGGLTALVRSDIRTIVQTRRFSAPDALGERRMRPGAYSDVPTTLIVPMPRSLVRSSIRQSLERSLGILIQQGKVSELRVEVSIPVDGALRFAIFYRTTETDVVQTFELETSTETVDVNTLSTAVRERMGF